MRGNGRCFRCSTCGRGSAGNRFSDSLPRQDVLPLLVLHESHRLLLPSLPWHLPADDGQMDALLKGVVTVFGYPWAWATRWLLLASERRIPAPCGRAGFLPTFRFRPRNPCGDVRIAWEPSRLQHLALLALLAQQAEPGRAHQAPWRRWRPSSSPGSRRIRF
jgi:hypothetical protein